MTINYLPVPGSSPFTTGSPVGYPSPTADIELILQLRRQPLAGAAAGPLGTLLGQLPHLRSYLTHDELAAASGGYPDDIATVNAYFAPFGLRIKAQNRLLARLTLAGSIADFERALRTEIAAFLVDNASFLANTTAYQLPAQLLEVVRAVQPLQPPVRKESRLPTKPLPPAPPLDDSLATPAEPAGYSPVELARAYGFPTGATGQGQVVGIVELGGKLNQDDLKLFFSEIGVAMPQISEVGTPPASPSPNVLNNMEVALDIQVVGAIAPQANIVVYYGATLTEALQAAVSDEQHKPSVISVSWAGSELVYSAAEVAEMSLVLYQASLLGISVVAASADRGAYNQQSILNVSLPSSNPLVLGCGGTTPTIANGVLSSEVVWNQSAYGVAVGSGGGYSRLYLAPFYQSQAIARYPYQKAVTRGVPDVAADASGINGYRVVFNGQWTVIGGTSGATPFVATLLALLNEKLGYRLGFINAILYGLAGSAAFGQITQGNNQGYAAAPYWNPCTGLGSPRGEQLLTLLKKLEPASTSPAEESTAPKETATDAATSPNEETAPSGGSRARRGSRA